MIRQASDSQPLPAADESVFPPQAIKPLTGTICFELRKASGAIATAMMTEFSQWRLKPSEATLLSFIGANPGCTQSEIARAFRAKAANLVSLIARLEQEGMVTRTPGRGRTITISLSEAGVTMLREVDAGFVQLENTITRDLDEQQRQIVVEALRLICRAACHYGRDANPGESVS